MSYEPTNWKAGDTVTSAKLNKMEQGIANSGSSNLEVIEAQLDEEENIIVPVKTEVIVDMMDSGKVVYVMYKGEDPTSFNYIPLVGAAYGAFQDGIWTFAGRSLGPEGFTLFYGMEGEFPTTVQPEGSGKDDSGDDSGDEGGVL